MQVKLFDFEHEEDLEDAINAFLKEEKNIIIDKISYQVSNFGNVKSLSRCVRIHDKLGGHRKKKE